MERAGNPALALVALQLAQQVSWVTTTSRLCHSAIVISGATSASFAGGGYCSFPLLSSSPLGEIYPGKVVAACSFPGSSSINRSICFLEMRNRK